MVKVANLHAKVRPPRVALADGTYDAIKTMILDHEISPGDRVGIDQLARELSVSQTPVREALARLEADGLLTKTPLRGYKTTELLSIQQFDELFQYRALVEPWLASQASRRGTRVEIEGMNAELERAENIRSAETTGSMYREFVEHDARLHALIAQAAGNSFIEQAFTQMHCHLHLFRVYKATHRNEQVQRSRGAEVGFVHDMFDEYYRGGERPLALTEHREIVNAIASGDGNSARELMLNHIESSRRRFIPSVAALEATS